MPVDLDLSQIMPPVAPSATPEPEAPAPVVEETEEQAVARKKFEQDEAKRNAAKQAALNEMQALGVEMAHGQDALTNAGIRCTELVWDKVVGEADVEAMYDAFASGQRARAQGGEYVKADKSAYSRFRSFFKPAVAEFIYGRKGVNHNWHDTVERIRTDILPDDRKLSLYNSLVTFNRMVVDAKLAASQVITEEAVTKALSRDAVKAKTVGERLDALLKAAQSCVKKTGATEEAIVKPIADYIAKLSTEQKAMLAE